MNALVVYYSVFGNTKAVAEVIGATLQSAASVQVIESKQLSAASLSNVDLLVVGSPTHSGRLPQELRAILESLPRKLRKGGGFAAFDTSYNMNWFVNLFTASKPLNSKLRKLGGVQVAQPQSFFVEGREGPLCSGEIERAKSWAATLVAASERLSQHSVAPGV